MSLKVTRGTPPTVVVEILKRKSIQSDSKYPNNGEVRSCLRSVGTSNRENRVSSCYFEKLSRTSSTSNAKMRANFLVLELFSASSETNLKLDYCANGSSRQS